MTPAQLGQFYELDASGYGCFCRKCKRHFDGTRAWHAHAKACLGDDIIAPEPKFPTKDATQLGFSDDAGPWVRG